MQPFVAAAFGLEASPYGRKTQDDRGCVIRRWHRWAPQGSQATTCLRVDDRDLGAVTSGSSRPRACDRDERPSGRRWRSCARRPWLAPAWRARSCRSRSPTRTGRRSSSCCDGSSATHLNQRRRHHCYHDQRHGRVLTRPADLATRETRGGRCPDPLRPHLIVEIVEREHWGAAVPPPVRGVVTGLDARGSGHDRHDIRCAGSCPWNGGARALRR